MKYPDSLEGYFRYTIRKEESRITFHAVLRLLFVLKLPYNIQRDFDIKKLTIIGRPTFPKGVFNCESHNRVCGRVPGMGVQLGARHTAVLQPILSGYQDSDVAELIYGRVDFGYVGTTIIGHLFLLFLIDQGVTVTTYKKILDEVKMLLVHEAERPIHRNIFKRVTITYLEERVTLVETYKEMIEHLVYPRKVVLAIKDREHSEFFMMRLIPLMHPDGLIIDISESEYADTTKRSLIMKKQDVFFLACGVKFGPHYGVPPFCIMVGGTKTAWPQIKRLLQNASPTLENISCCNFIGEDACGQFVKIVLDGIEHMEMQLIIEAYLLLKEGLGLQHSEMSKVFHSWNTGLTGSFLIEATSAILACKYKLNEEEKKTVKKWHKWPLLALIHIPRKDELLQTENLSACSAAAIDMGGPCSINNAVASVRCMPTWQQFSHDAREYLRVPSETYDGDKDEFTNHISKALYASRVLGYIQSLLLIKVAAKQCGWNVNYSTIMHTWRGYPNTRSFLLCKLEKMFQHHPNLVSVFSSYSFADDLCDCQKSLRHVVTTAVKLKIPVPAFTAALSFYDGVRANPLPTSLTEAMCNYLGYDKLHLS